MSSFFKHAGLFIAGAACIVGGVFVPPVAGILGTVGTKLLIAAGAAAWLGVDVDTVKAGIKGTAEQVTKKP